MWRAGITQRPSPCVTPFFNYTAIDINFTTRFLFKKSFYLLKIVCLKIKCSANFVPNKFGYNHLGGMV